MRRCLSLSWSIEPLAWKKSGQRPLSVSTSRRPGSAAERALADPVVRALAVRSSVTAQQPGRTGPSVLGAQRGHRLLRRVRVSDDAVLEEVLGGLLHLGVAG